MFCAKLAPWLVDGVIENSGGVEAQLQHIGLGKEIDFTRYLELLPVNTYPHLSIYTSTKTHWSLNPNSKNRFSPARKAIRALFNKEHLNTQANYPKPFYVCYHSKFDRIASFDLKQEFINELLNLGFEVNFKAFSSEEQIDNQFIKNLNHGMDIPLKMLIEKELFPLLEKIKKRKKAKCEKSISYICDDLKYTFFEKNAQMHLKIKQLEKAEN